MSIGELIVRLLVVIAIGIVGYKLQVKWIESIVEDYLERREKKD